MDARVDARRCAPVEFSQEQIQDLRKRFFEGKTKEERDKAAALLLLSKGDTVASVSKITGKHPKTIKNWVRVYQESGRLTNASATWQNEDLREFLVRQFYGRPPAGCLPPSYTQFLESWNAAGFQSISINTLMEIVESSPRQLHFHIRVMQFIEWLEESLASDEFASPTREKLVEKMRELW